MALSGAQCSYKDLVYLADLDLPGLAGVDRLPAGSHPREYSVLCSLWQKLHSRRTTR